MLEFLRKRAQSLVIQVIVVIIALVFIFWGVGTNLMNRQEAAIVVGSEEVSFQQFQQAYDNAYSLLAQQFGGTVPKGLAESLNIKQQVIGQLTREALLRQGGMAMGLAVSGREIQQAVEEMVQFQENGAFSIERYQSILAANRLSPEKYEQSLGYDLLGTKTLEHIGAFSQVATDFEIEELYTLEKESATVSYAVFAPASYVDRIVVGEDDLAAWYADNGGAYRSEKEVKLSYLPFLFADIGARITVGEEEVRTYYDDHLSDFQIREQRRARHILLRAAPGDSEEVHVRQQARAEEILALARGGEDFAALAMSHSEGPTGPDGGDLGFFSRGQMVQPFEDAVFSMAAGEISEVVKTDFGYHLIKLEEIQPGGTTSLQDAATEITARLRLEQARPMAFQLANEAYENIIGAGSLAAYLQAQPQATMVETDYFKASSPPAGLTADPAFLERAFALKETELSSIVETDDGYVILSASAVREPQVPDLATVRDQAERDYRQEQAVQMARDQAAQFLAGLQSAPSTFEQAAAAAGLTVESSGPLLKNDPAHASAFPQALVPQVFRLSLAAPLATEPGEVDGQFYVYRFDRRTPPATALSDEDRSRYRELLLQFKRQRLLDAWLRDRQAEADIRIHKSLENF